MIIPLSISHSTVAHFLAASAYRSSLRHSYIHNFLETSEFVFVQHGEKHCLTMYPYKSPRNSCEDHLMEGDIEESLLHEKSNHFSRFNNFVSWFNVLFALSNIVAAASIYLSRSETLPSTNAEYRMQEASILWHYSKLMIQGPLRNFATYQDQYWDLGLGKLSEFTGPPSAEVDANWNSISAPPGDGE